MVCSLVSIYLDSPQLSIKKNKLCKTLDWFSRIGSRNSFSTPFWCVIFLKKCFSCYILLTDIISLSDWLHLLLEILDNMYIAIVCTPGCDVINFEINLIFLIKPFFYMTKKSRQKLKHVENETSSQGEITSVFHHF